MKNQPCSVDAVWFMGKMPGCKDDTGSALMCETYARQVHSIFMASFGLTEEQLCR